MKTVAIVLNSPSPLAEIEENELICADGGYSRVVGAEKKTVIIGDLDSLGSAPEGVPVLTCPTDKDYTDGEKAVRYAADKGYEKIVLYGADGGRMDMQVANLFLLKIAYDLSLSAEINSEKERVFYTEKDFFYSCPVGKRVSVLPLGGDTVFSSSEGLVYPLSGLRLTCRDTVGISNKTTKSAFRISVKTGGALIFIEK